MKNLALIMGTRPEVIKFAPLVHELSRSSAIKPLVIATGQHRSMANQAFRIFDIDPDLDLDLMQDNQSPTSFLSRLLGALEQHLPSMNLSGVIVQGDTTTTLGASLAAFHLQLPVFHLEAGLRTGRLDSPFPEEMNRSLVSRIASLHFAPTASAAANLEKEGILKPVFVVGNTVVDAVLSVRERIESGLLPVAKDLRSFVSRATSFVLVTGHRRENFDAPLASLCNVLLRLQDKLPEVHFVYPVHKNPNVIGPVHELLSNQPRIHLMEPLEYPDLVYLLSQCSLVISDSGGIQEEAPSFGKRILVTRETTERPEAIKAGFALLAPLSEPDRLFDLAINALTTPVEPLAADRNPFGSGNAAKLVSQELEAYFR